ncbi:hypothetical protein JOC55_002723 [Paenibacillus sacheonensis]|nr:hypothetical protein [Paenibacillus sacheonensis]
MEEVRTLEELIERLSKLTKEDSICQVSIPGKGTFTIVLQEDYRTVNNRLDDENNGRVTSVSELSRNPFL